MPITVKQIPPEEAESAPILTLEVQESQVLTAGTGYTINACGYVGSERKANDGCVYMGTRKRSEETNECVNDILIGPEDQGMGERHLLIKYSIEAKSYYIKDLGEGTGTFIKVECPLVLKQGHIISFGDSHMVVHLRPNGKIQLKFLDGPKTDQTLYFVHVTSSTFHANDGVVKIGRMSDCEVRFDDNSLSRYQCS